jgi:hypothetical protein
MVKVHHCLRSIIRTTRARAAAAPFRPMPAAVAHASVADTRTVRRVYTLNASSGELPMEPFDDTNVHSAHSSLCCAQSIRYIVFEWRTLTFSPGTLHCSSAYDGIWCTFWISNRAQRMRCTCQQNICFHQSPTRMAAHFVATCGLIRGCSKMSRPFYGSKCRQCNLYMLPPT